MGQSGQEQQTLKFHLSPGILWATPLFYTQPWEGKRETYTFPPFFWVQAHFGEGSQQRRNETEQIFKNISPSRKTKGEITGKYYYQL